MTRLESLRDMLRHQEWADAEVWRATLELETGALDEKLGGWLHHVHMVQRAFLAVWRGEPVELGEPGDFPDPPALARWGRSGHARIAETASTWEDGSLEETIVFPWAAEVTGVLGRDPGPVTRGESALQVCLHTAHHRGQIAARLRDLGGAPPLIDYIGWLWLERPDPAWPEIGYG